MATFLLKYRSCQRKRKIRFAMGNTRGISSMAQRIALVRNGMKWVGSCYLTSRGEYEAAGAGIGAAWRETLGRNFPPSTLLYISRLVDERAKVQIEVTAFAPAA